MIIFIVVAALVAFGYVFMQQAKFGKIPSEERLERIKKSPNYKDGKFQNLSHTPDLAEGVTYYAVMKEFIFGKNKRNKPDRILPSKKTNLLTISPEKNVLVWFGHSSYFMQIDGKKILVDPVFSGAASPVKFTTRSFEGTDVYTVDDFPEIDYLFISHDHWDHLDHETLVKMRPKIKKVITGLGTGEHLEQWGYDKGRLVEKDWNERVELDSGFTVTFLPARHFSGRGFSRNLAIWVSFAFQTPTMKIYIGGDSGYDTHFAKIGETYGSFDLALLECGQYDKSWKYIHMMPEEVVEAAKELKAKRLMPVHWAKFSLGNHAWDDPIIRVTEAAKQNHLPILTPMIGEEVNLKDSTKVYPAWWETVR